MILATLQTCLLPDGTENRAPRWRCGRAPRAGSGARGARRGKVRVRMEGASGEENASLYRRGTGEGYRGFGPDPSALLELLDGFGEDGLRSYLMGFIEGQEMAEEKL